MDNSFQFSDMLLCYLHICVSYTTNFITLCNWSRLFLASSPLLLYTCSLSCHAAECVLLLVHTIIVVHVVYAVHLDDLICVHNFIMCMFVPLLYHKATIKTTICLRIAL